MTPTDAVVALADDASAVPTAAMVRSVGVNDRNDGSFLTSAGIAATGNVAKRHGIHLASHHAKM